MYMPNPLSDNIEEDLRMTKLETIRPILNYRFPDLNLSFLLDCSLEELDEILNNIIPITQEQLKQYPHH